MIVNHVLKKERKTKQNKKTTTTKQLIEAYAIINDTHILISLLLVLRSSRRDHHYCSERSFIEITHFSIAKRLPRGCPLASGCSAFSLRCLVGNQYANSLLHNWAPSRENPFRARSDTNQTVPSVCVQAQNMTKGLIFQIKQKKGADQRRSYSVADMRLLFNRIFRPLASFFCKCTGRFGFELVGYPDGTFFRRGYQCFKMAMYLIVAECLVLRQLYKMWHFFKAHRDKICFICDNKDTNQMSYP